MTRVRFARPAWRRMLSHASQVARDRRTEAIGWLLGWFAPGEVVVLDSVGATRYKMQSRYGAQADPREELEVATSYPRVVGIVGLYHSHPFRDETQHAIFHSKTDDATLRSRAARRRDYLSVVTDGHDAEVFVLERGKQQVSPAVEDGLGYREALRPYRCDASLRVRRTLAVDRMEGLVGALERELSEELAAALRGAEADLDPKAGALRVPGLEGNAARNALVVTRSDGAAKVDLQIRSEVTVYLPEAQEDDALTVLREEIQDDVVYLLWHGLDPKALTGPVADLEANLGSLRVQETNPLPKKLYKAAKRSLVVKKGRPT